MARRCSMLLLATLMASIAMASATTYSECPSTNPCPKDGIFFYCQAGNAINGCRAHADGPFPTADCSTLCKAYPPAPPACTTVPPCPKDGTYYYCQAGNAVNGCRPLADGAFPTIDCSAQCKASPPPLPPTCTGASPCAAGSVYCQAGAAINGCRAPADGPFPTVDCSAQCTTPSAPAPTLPPACTSASPCAVGFVYCQAGAAINGCRAPTDGPFPAVDCSSQCTTPSAPIVTVTPDPTTPLPAPAPCSPQLNQGNPCPRFGNSVWCYDDDIVRSPASNGCRASALGAFPTVDCAADKQCSTWPLPDFCPVGTPNSCPQDGRDYYLCTGTGSEAGKCQAAALGPYDGGKCSQQCLTVGYCPKPLEDVDDVLLFKTFAEGCPKDGGYYYMCLDGLEIRGCRKMVEGPHYQPVDCTYQCTLPPQDPTPSPSPSPSPVESPVGSPSPVASPVGSPSPVDSPVGSPSPADSPVGSPSPAASPSPGLVTGPAPSPSPRAPFPPSSCPEAAPIGCQAPVEQLANPINAAYKCTRSPAYTPIQVISSTGTTVVFSVYQYMKCDDTISWMNVYDAEANVCSSVYNTGKVPFGLVQPTTFTATCGTDGFAAVHLWYHDGYINTRSGTTRVNLRTSVPAGCHNSADDDKRCVFAYKVPCRNPTC